MGVVGRRGQRHACLAREGGSSILCTVDSLTPYPGVTLESAIRDTLLDVVLRLEAATSTPRVRAMRNQARMYIRAVNDWHLVPPSAQSRDAMLDLVTDLQQEILSIRERTT